MHSFVSSIFKREMHLPSLLKLWQMPDFAQFPIPVPFPFLSTPLEVQATSNFAAMVSISSFSMIESSLPVDRYSIIAPS